MNPPVLLDSIPPSQPIEVDSSQWTNRKATDQAQRAATARQASGRRRLVDPATCDRDYSPSELEFMQAMHEYKHKSGRMFPTWSEVLEVLHSLGYEKLAEVRTYPQVTTLVNRIDWLGSFANEVPFILAAETLMEIEAPPRAQWRPRSRARYWSRLQHRSGRRS